MSSYTLKLFRESDDGFLILTNGKVGALRKYPFSTNTYVLSAIPNYNGAYQIASITESNTYKLFTGNSLTELTEDVSWGGDNGIYISVDDNNWTYDSINSIYLTNTDYNVLIGATGSDINKLAVLGNVSITGNLYASSLSSLTAGLTLNQYTLTSSFISSTGFLNTRINTVSSSLISLSSNVGNLNRYTLTSDFIASTASLTGGTLLSKTSSQIYLTNSSDSLRLGNSTGVSAMKLEVQGQVLIGNTTYYGSNAEKGRISWGGNPQSFNVYSLSTLNYAIGTEGSGEVITVASGGNVGIATTTPQQKLDVNGAVNFRSALFFGLTGEKGTLTFNSNDFIVRGNPNHNLQLGTNFTNVITVASSYNVGINTTTPNNKLSVSGDTSITGALTVTGGRTSLTGSAIIKGDGTNAILQLYTGAGSNIWNFRNNGILDIGAGTLDFTSDFNLNNQLVLKSSNGNVGIGNLIPTSRLSVSGNISSTGNIISSTGTDIGLFSLSTGRVGINQSAPTVAFEVSGSLVGGQSFSLGKCPNNAIGFAFNRHFPTGNIYDSTRYAFQFTRPSNADRFSLEVYNGAGTLITGNAITIDSVGNLGILTNSPTTGLDINANTMRLRSSRTPSSSGDTGNQGDHCWDSNYLYICTATNTWKRVALSSW